MKKIKVGLMGFGELGRHLYNHIQEDDRFDVVVICDTGKPEILHYLLKSETKGKYGVEFKNNHLVSPKGVSRIMRIEKPQNIPWDLFKVDFVVDSTGKYMSKKHMKAHLKNGAKRVILSGLPEAKVDRVAIIGVNDCKIKQKDRLISPGSPTTNAYALLLTAINDKFGLDHAWMTTIHEYTADQPLRDVAGANYRRSRSAAENIIPNQNASANWIQKILPEFAGKIDGSALNVPVPAGSLIDLTIRLKDSKIEIDDVHQLMYDMEKKMPGVIAVSEDPIVSTDIIGNLNSVVYDKRASMKSNGKLLKLIGWYHNTLAHSARIKELMLKYNELDTKGGSK